MDRVLSVDGISDKFWSSPPPALPTEAEASSKLNRSASEWSFRQFLQEASVSDSSASPPRPPASPSSAADQSQENAKQVLQKQSDRNDRDRNRNRKICRSSATSRMEKSKAADSVNFGPPCLPPDSGDYQAFLKSKLNLACAAVALCRGSYMKAQDSCASSPLAHNESQAKASQLPSQPPPKGISSSPCVQKKAGILVSSATVSSSREQTDEDDDIEGDNGTNEQMDP